jgi:hypothetical protein
MLRDNQRPLPDNIYASLSSGNNGSRLHDKGKKELFDYVFSSRYAKNNLKRVTDRLQTSKKGQSNE